MGVSCNCEGDHEGESSHCQSFSCPFCDIPVPSLSPAAIPPLVLLH